MGTPDFKQVANLWSLWDYPAAFEPWSLEQQLDAVKGAGFDGFTAQLGPRHAQEAQKRGLLVVGYFSSGDEDRFADLLRSQKDAGARHVNVQLADHDTDPGEALRLAVRLMEEAERIGDLESAIEVHRDTCTETPEKTYALADGYFKATGELLPLTWDFSHLAVVKHLTPEIYVERLLVRRELIQRSQISFSSFQRSPLSASGDLRRWTLDQGNQRLAAFCGRYDEDLAGGQCRS
jgi:sugar phosphate isomerase/epimerase